MAKFFNTSGPCRPEDHYIIDIGERFKNIRKLIDNKHYFILHAPMLPPDFSKCRVGGFGVAQNSMIKTNSAHQGLIGTE